MPTILEACGGCCPPAGLRFDGRSVVAALAEGRDVAWPDRTLFFQWHRGDRPEPDRAFAARTQKYKLLRPEPPAGSGKVPALELYDIEIDPFEQHNLAAEQPAIVDECTRSTWPGSRTWRRLGVLHLSGSSIGGQRENPTILTRQDSRGPRAGWGPTAWVTGKSRSRGRGVSTSPCTSRPGTCRPWPTSRSGASAVRSSWAPNVAKCTFADLPVTAGPGRLEAWVDSNGTRLAFSTSRLAGNEESWSVERGAWGVERGAWSVERGAWSVERGAWMVGSVERGAWSVGRGAWSVERGAWGVER